MGCELSRQLREACCGLSMLLYLSLEHLAVRELVEATVALRETRRPITITVPLVVGGSQHGQCNALLWLILVLY